MSPRKRKSENKGLPERWRFRYNAYYYRVPPGMESQWDGKSEFRLGNTLAESYKVYAERLVIPDELETMRHLFNRYRLEVIPTKAESTQITDKKRLITLEMIFGDNLAQSITTKDCYRLLDSMTTKRGARTANNHITLLSHVFTMAIRWGVISEHPIKGKLIKNKLTPKRHLPKRAEIDEALKVAPPLIKAYVRFKLLTGLRQADILTLKVNCIKDDGIHITPRKTQFSSGKSVIIEWDSTGELKRSILEIKSLKRPVGSFWLFCNKRGEPYFKEGNASGFQSIWQRWIKKALDETDLQIRFTERSIRTFVGSEFDTPEEASRLLAHADVKTTKAHYREKPEKVKPLTNNKKT